MLGGITLDLHDASMDGTAQLDVTAIMGGVELRVPSNWNMHVSGIPLMGGWEDKAAKPTQKNAPLLNIQATCIMGGLEIKN